MVRVSVLLCGQGWHDFPQEVPQGQTGVTAEGGTGQGGLAPIQGGLTTGGPIGAGAMPGSAVLCEPDNVIPPGPGLARHLVAITVPVWLNWHGQQMRSKASKVSSSATASENGLRWHRWCDNVPP